MDINPSRLNTVIRASVCTPDERLDYAGIPNFRAADLITGQAGVVIRFAIQEVVGTLIGISDRCKRPMGACDLRRAVRDLKQARNLAFSLGLTETASELAYLLFSIEAALPNDRPNTRLYDHDEIAQLKREGRSHREIRELTGASASTVELVLSRAGLTKRRVTVAQIVELKAAGKEPKEIASDLGVSIRVVNRRLATPKRAAA